MFAEAAIHEEASLLRGSVPVLTEASIHGIPI
jgi:hypothetical protein